MKCPTCGSIVPDRYAKCEDCGKITLQLYVEGTTVLCGRCGGKARAARLAKALKSKENKAVKPVSDKAFDAPAVT